MTAAGQSMHLQDALQDLATTADRLAARAAHLGEIDASSALFVLADELRTMAELVKTSVADDATYQLLDEGRWRISRTMLRLDDLERTCEILSQGANA
jgi:hypothetical protein